MFGSIFGRKENPAEALLEKKGVNLKILREQLDRNDEELLFGYIEKNLLNADFEVIFAPFNLQSRLGTILYPLIIRMAGKIFTFITWDEKWDLETVREMLVLFGLMKRKKYLKSSFIVISPYKVPTTLSYFMEDSPGVRFHLLNLIDLAVERVGGSMIKLFNTNFKEAFGFEVSRDVKGLEMFDKTASKYFNVPSPRVQFTEPVKASMFLSRRYLEHVLLKETTAIYRKQAEDKEGKKKLNFLEFQDSYFLVDFRSKIFHDFSCTEDFNTADLVRQIQRCLENPEFIPDRNTFPFFRWIYTLQESSSKQTKEIKNLTGQILPMRAEHVKKKMELSEVTVYRVFRCECNSYFIDMENFPREPVFTLDKFREQAHRATSYEGDYSTAGGKCPECDRVVSYANLRYSRFCRFIPDLGWDLHYQLERSTANRLVGTWFGVDPGGKPHYMGHEISEEDICRTFKRYISAVPIWKHLFKRAAKTGKIDMVAVEKYYHIMVIPPLEKSEEKKQMEKILEPLQISEQNFHRYDLREIADSGLFNPALSFHHWLPEYSHQVINGRYKAIALFNLRGFRKNIQQLIEKLKIDYVSPSKDFYTVFQENPAGIPSKDSEKEADIPVLNGKNLSRGIKIDHLILEIIHSGLNPGDFTLTKFAETLREFQQLKALFKKVIEIIGPKYTLNYIQSTDTLMINEKVSGKNLEIKPTRYISKRGIKEKEIRDALGEFAG